MHPRPEYQGGDDDRVATATATTERSLATAATPDVADRARLLAKGKWQTIKLTTRHMQAIRVVAIRPATRTRDTPKKHYKNALQDNNNHSTGETHLRAPVQQNALLQTTYDEHVL